MNTEGIEKWNADAIILKKDANQTVEQSLFNISKVQNTYEQSTTLKQQGVIISNHHHEENALLFGVTHKSFLIPPIIKGHQVESSNEVVIDQSLADKGFKIGDILSLSQSDEKLKVVGIVESAKYNASPVLFSNNKTIEKLNPKLSKDKTNAIVVKDSNWKNHKLNKDLESISISQFIKNLPGYKAQNLTLNFMIVFLFIISATVIGVFLYVITLQKTHLFGVLKAQGFTNGYLAKMVFAQTFILSLIGTIIGFLLTLLTGTFLPSVVPIHFNLLTMLIYGIVLIIISLLGSLFSVLSIIKINPLKAIG
ncbi:peptide ABC transporter permease [Staphylococcus epidermidis]|nr:peptide ABC transporter permease [Staphylococcus sp. HMSC065D05]RTE13387.1 peptide ABC transporter permease [Staphylococcus epidermidis]RTE16103.1 peptide ABC transporter permease [Staphylococcus epidermidis]RTE16817.1 peptide ABC transporter permease [Staphylococcus epidermidis]RTE21172.1 peptide ABC transporter permease [Staphylococcus epidermidis]